jgi:hypothetical protein
MRILKFSILLAALTAIELPASTPASAGCMSLLGVGRSCGGGGGGGGSATFTPGVAVAIQNIAFGSATATFTGMNGGVNYPAGALVNIGFAQSQAGYTYSAITIGGQTATLVSGTQDSSSKCQIYQAVMPSSQPDTFSITASSLLNVAGAAGAYMTNLSSTVVSAANNETFGAQPDPQILNDAALVPSGGFGFVFVAELAATSGAGAPPTALTWVNTTSGSGDTFVNLLSGTDPYVIGSAHNATGGSWSNNTPLGPGATGVTNPMSFFACMSAATWH